jgi:hypothetical protein
MAGGTAFNNAGSHLGNHWSFDNAKEWSRYAYADEDSAELVIGLDSTYPEVYNKLSRNIAISGGKIVNKVLNRDRVWAIVADVPLISVSSFADNIRASKLVRYIEPNIKFKADFVPNDPNWNLQWGPVKIEADKAWDTQRGNSSVVVAVVDTGIDWNHPDLASNYVSLGYDWVNNDTDPMDDEGHGSHCAGIIAATINNEVGIAGLAQVQIMAEKGLDYTGSGWEDDLANAIIHAVDQGADIISNSWGGYEDGALVHDAVKYAYDHGVSLIAAAGNDAFYMKHYPAAYDEVVAVTATDQEDDPASFTNYGDWVELGAPGVNIWSTIWDDSYDYNSGTSMATPHVSGIAALVWSQFPSMTRDQVRAQLRCTAQDLGDPGFDKYYGYGRVNAKTAVEQAPAAHDLLVFDWKKTLAVKLGRPKSFNVTVLNFGTSDETNVQVKLLVNGTLVDSASISSFPRGASQTVDLSWTPLEKHDYNITVYVVPVVGETTTQNNKASQTVSVSPFAVALFENALPWGFSANEEVLAKYKIPYDVFTSSDFGSVDLSKYTKVVIPSDQDQAFYDAVSAYRGWFENYASNGGILEIHAADGSHAGQWVGTLPGDLDYTTNRRQLVSIVDPNHPVVNAPNKITDDELDNWNYAIHGFFTNFPSSYHIVIVDDRWHWPVWLEVTFGSGIVMASSQTLEWAYLYRLSLILENSLLYRISVHPDLAITNLEPSKTVVGQNYNMRANVTVENRGDSTETFNVTLYAKYQGMYNESSLISHWKFDEGSGTTAHDSSNSANHGKIYGASWVEGKYGKALSFDGVDDYVDCGNWPGLNLQYGDCLTIMAWVKFSHTYLPQTIVSHGDDSYLFYIERDIDPQYWLNWKKARWGGANPEPYSVELSADEWHHVAIVSIIGVHATFYIDGKNKGTSIFQSTYDYPKNLTIGISDSEGFPFNGIIDEVKIYNRTVLDWEIWEEYAPTAYASVIQKQTVTLEEYANTILTFEWNTTDFIIGKYILCAVADVVSGETVTTNNFFSRGYVFVTIAGDASGDFKVDGKDIARIAKAYNTAVGDPLWNPDADIDNDYKVDGKDIAVASKNYGKQSS